MSTPKDLRCGKCGAELAAFATEGVCSACLLELGLSADPRRIPAAAEKPGDRIGRYKLLEQIGQGGMGTVWMAEQDEPVRRRVALKLIKLGMDTKQVIARFEAERQALALMDHPNVAKVLDAGASETGRPYFVMELVRGSRITDYCDQYRLSTRERLELLLQVCRAIQHAHQKGIIHRDIKPSNILVTQQDGKAAPMVIDFGVAKATGGQVLTDKTVFTISAQFIGTPVYMSPEQAAGKWDIDTRTDIYALGVLLYEVLTGKTPFDSKDLLHGGWDLMRRKICDTDPPSPSMRLTTLAPVELNRIARCRRAEPPRLIHIVRGDLDWIVMKCLEKEPGRRYATCVDIANDIERHLYKKPVAARPASNFYRFQKLVSRNRQLFFAGGAVFAALVIGLAASAWFFLKERQARNEVKAAQEQANEAEKNTRVREEAARVAQERSERRVQLFIDTQIKRKFLPPSPARRTNSIPLKAESLGGNPSNELSAPEVFRPYSIEADLIDNLNDAVPKGYSPVVSPEGNDYPRLAREWWKWLMELPLNTGGIEHPIYDSDTFDVRLNQSGTVWFLVSPFGTVTRNCLVPQDTWLFIGLLNAEASNIEDPPFFGANENDQLEAAGYIADHIVSLSCEVDGVPIADMRPFRIASRQVEFMAPTPWIYGTDGGPGTSSGDGYFIFLRPLSPGQHIIHYKGVFLFLEVTDGFYLNEVIEMTYHITVQ
jgi:hypothetical protein